MQKFEVIRHHEGDKTYAPGDIREADPRDVAHLIGRCLKPVEPKSVKGAAPQKKDVAPKVEATVAVSGAPHPADAGAKVEAKTAVGGASDPSASGAADAGATVEGSA